MRHAAHVLSLLPDGLGSLSPSEDLSAEFSDYGKLYRVWSAMEKVVECGSREVTSMTRDGTANWRSEYEVCSFRPLFRYYFDLNVVDVTDSTQPSTRANSRSFKVGLAG